MQSCLILIWDLNYSNDCNEITIYSVYLHVLLIYVVFTLDCTVVYECRTNFQTSRRLEKSVAMDLIIISAQCLNLEAEHYFEHLTALRHFRPLLY